MCPPGVISRHACRGYLHKLSSRIRSWQKRWFVFDRSKNKRTFMYYSDKSESKARGGVYFQVRVRGVAPQTCPSALLGVRGTVVCFGLFVCELSDLFFTMGAPCSMAVLVSFSRFT